MNEESQDNRLHLPSLSIAGFRGIDSLAIERLGRVTLLAGKNSVGKTTVLDAVRVYAARAHRAVLSEILESNGEVAALEHLDGGQGFGPCWEAIFNGRDASGGASLSIGPNNRPDQLVIGVTHQKSTSLTVKSWNLPTRILKVIFEEVEVAKAGFCPYTLSTRITRSRAVFQSEWVQDKPPNEIICQSMGPELWTNDEIMERWNAIALTADEDQVVKALQPILGEQLIRIAISGDEKHHRRMMAKLRVQPFPVPLKSFGDGAMRQRCDSGHTGSSPGIISETKRHSRDGPEVCREQNPAGQAPRLAGGQGRPQAHGCRHWCWRLAGGWTTLQNLRGLAGAPVHVIGPTHAD